MYKTFHLKWVHYFLAQNLYQPQAKTLAVPERMDDVEGQSQIFYLIPLLIARTTATARKVITDVPTSYGLKTLNIWVSDDSFDKEDGSNDVINLNV